MFTIFKVLIHNSTNKLRVTNNGFTLLELLVGLILMSIVGGLAMNAFVNANTSFGKDKKNIDTSQDLSAVLEIVGNDIRQAGENINDGSFPAIEFKVADAINDPNLVPGSSKIIIRRAVSLPMTLCENITPAMATTTSLSAPAPGPIAKIGTLAVADNAISNTFPNAANCAVGTQTSPLFAGRPNGNYTGTYVVNQTAAGGATTQISPLPALPTGRSGTLSLVLPDALRQARDYRCAQADPNPTIPYNSPAQPSNADFCPTGGGPSVRIAVSDGAGRMLIFNQTGEADLSPTSFTKYGIDYNASFVDDGINRDPAIDNNATALATLASFNPGDAVYVIEERVYTLVKDTSVSVNPPGILHLSKNGGRAVPLIKGIANFNVSAKMYSDSLLQQVDPTPDTLVTTGSATVVNSPPKTSVSIPTANICSGHTGVVSNTNPKYVCSFNYGTNSPATPPSTGTIAMNWKQIAGIRVALTAQYDGSGRSATASTADAAKLVATAEYFPRNVLSK
jgi:prepilin-type N-terminal cleavage/methylation domain-containing protein